ncbi:hypothetical protein NDU88_003362 [Pleurodeles waltl]|uniref:Uncharacterized protein n=1 Tax=Pleurodeles waltl TaxID=8319 RepID=A0AAV7LIL9_PLEWA|nr:hypothetical protein NDU88_003362 [Pleurodeles waltl]
MPYECLFQCRYAPTSGFEIKEVLPRSRVDLLLSQRTLELGTNGPKKLSGINMKELNQTTCGTNIEASESSDMDADESRRMKLHATL